MSPTRNRGLTINVPALLSGETLARALEVKDSEPPPGKPDANPDEVGGGSAVA